MRPEMLNVNQISIKTPEYGKYNNIKAPKSPNLKYEKDTVSFSGKKAKEADNSKVGFFEGAKLVLGGAKDRIKDMLLYPIKHPVSAIITGAITSLAMCALPLVGISTAAGAAALGVGFAAFSAFNMAKNVKNAISSHRENNNGQFRHDLKEIGASSVDLVFSARLLKRNLRNLRHQFKYGKIGPNKDFIEDFKNQKGISNKLKSLNKSNSKINAEINKFAGIDDLQRELKFSDDVKKEYLKLYDIEDNEEFVSQAYKRLTTDLGYRDSKRNNAPLLVFDTSENKNYVAAHSLDNNMVIANIENLKLYDKNSILGALRHELQHFQQMIDIERTQNLGLEKMQMFNKKTNNKIALNELETNADLSSLTKEEAEAFIKSFKEMLEQPETTFTKNPKKEYINGKWYSDLASHDPIMLNSKDRYNLYTNIRKIAQEQGEIKPGTKAARRAGKFFNAFVNYTEKPYRKDCKNIFEYIVKCFKYTFNYIEIDARNAEYTITPLLDGMEANCIMGTMQANLIKSSERN